jgi:hypothetical protein
MRSIFSQYTLLVVSGTLALLLSSCTQDAQNELGRSFQNWTGTDGVLDIYAGEKLVQRFIKIDKLTTARESDTQQLRPYRFGYGHNDANFNFQVDADERKTYFEIGTNGSNYVFYENTKR